jgi:uncharacterized protein (TIGR00730 family)
MLLLPREFHRKQTGCLPMPALTTLTIYCGSRNGHHPDHAALAQTVGRGCAERGIAIVYGGGALGLMGEMARAALVTGGTVTGVIPGFLRDLEVAQTGLTDMITVPTMHARKAMMVARGDAIACLPGGPGTLDEMVEALTWASLGLHSKPCYLIDPDGYWQPVLALFDHLIDQGFTEPRFRDLLTVADSLDAVIEDFESRSPNLRRPIVAMPPLP